MLDIKKIKNQTKKVKQACEDKSIDPQIVDKVLELEEKRSALDTQIQELRAESNALIDGYKKKPPQSVIDKGKELKQKINEKEEELKRIKKEQEKNWRQIPGIPDDSVPRGDKPEVVREWGDKKKFDFHPKDHIQLGLGLDLLDLERGSKVAGYRGYFLKNEAVLMHLGLMEYALKKLIKKGFQPFTTPAINKRKNFFYSGHFPWGEKEAYKLDENGESETFLAGTAEVPMVGYHADEVFKEEDLPIKYVAFSPCYRREIGSYGKDTRGIYRLHEFLKIEQVIFIKNSMQESEKWLNELANNSEEILQDLKLPYRVCLMPTEDMGEPQIKKYDIEAWMPGREDYGELMSDSIMGDFQSRRANIRYQTKDGERKYVHTLNNTAIASPRTLIAIFENYQQKDGSIVVPEVLRNYVGKDKIVRKD